MRQYDEIGAVRDVQRADSRLKAYHVRRRPHSLRLRETNGRGALTSTESRITAFIARGWSNPDIAAELVVSHRTVQAHVSNIFKKLDVHSRIDLMREATGRTPASRAA